MTRIARSMAAAPPDQSVSEWARTTAEGRMLTTMRTLTPEQQEAWLRCLRHMADGMPAREAALCMYRECGLGEAKAMALAKRALGGGA